MTLLKRCHKRNNTWIPNALVSESVIELGNGWLIEMGRTLKHDKK